MLIRIPISTNTSWWHNTSSYSKIVEHPHLSVIVDTIAFNIKLSGKPYVTVRVLLSSENLTVNTPYVDFDNSDWDTFKPFDISGSGILRFSDNDGIIIPSSVSISTGTFVTVSGNQLVVGGTPVVL